MIILRLGTRPRKNRFILTASGLYLFISNSKAASIVFKAIALPMIFRVLFLLSGTGVPPTMARHTKYLCWETSYPFATVNFLRMNVFDTTFSAVETQCSPNPCLNVGQCLDVDDGYKCECAHGFKGHHCEGKRARTSLFLFSVK